MRKLILFIYFLAQTFVIVAQSSISLSEDVYGTGLPYPPDEYYRYPGNGKYYFHILDGNDLKIYELDSAAGITNVMHVQSYNQAYSVNLLGAVDDKISFWVRENEHTAHTEFWTYNISDGSFIKVETTNAYNGYYYKATFGNSICFLARYINNIGGFEIRLFKAPIDLGSNSQLISDVDVEGNPVIFNDALFYVTSSGGAGYPIYKTMGELSNTTHFDNIQGKVSYVTNCGNRLFFLSDRISTDDYDELWASDGTAQGTYKVLDLPENSYMPWAVTEVSACNEKFIFRYETEQYGTEMWISDGTGAGTHVLKDISVGQGSGYPENFIPMGDKLVFTTGMQNLWMTDGTENNTFIIKSLDAISPFAKINEKLFFKAKDATNNGWELWVTDGTTSGTSKVTPPTAANSPLGDINFAYRIFLGKLYFKAKYDGSLKWYKTTGDVGNTVQGESTLSAYPNPVVDQLTISSIEPCTITISNLSGNILYTFSLTGTQTIDVSSLQAGMYFVNASNGSSMFFIKSA